MSGTTVRRRPWWARGLRFSLGLARIKAVYFAEQLYYRLKWVETEAVYFAQVGATHTVGLVADVLRLLGIETRLSADRGILGWIHSWGERAPSTSWIRARGARPGS